MLISGYPAYLLKPTCVNTEHFKEATECCNVVANPRVQKELSLVQEPHQRPSSWRGDKETAGPQAGRLKRSIDPRGESMSPPWSLAEEEAIYNLLNTQNAFTRLFCKATLSARVSQQASPPEARLHRSPRPHWEYIQVVEPSSCPMSSSR